MTEIEPRAVGFAAWFLVGYHVYTNDPRLDMLAVWSAMGLVLWWLAGRT